MRRHDRTNLGIMASMAAALAVGCGGADDVDDPELGDELPRIEQVELSRLALRSEGDPAVLHPVELEVELDVVGDAFDADVLVGLRAEGGELGCVLGAMPISQAEPGRAHLSLRSEYFVGADCRDLVGRDDVELFAAFDPWGNTDFEREEVVVEDVAELYDVVRGAMLGTDSCADCRTSTTLLDSPGRDAQLREVELGSSVAVLALPASEDQERMPGVDAPHFQISSGVRVTGLAKGQGPLEGETFMSYGIRPLGGAPGTEALDGASLEWAPLLERSRDESGQAAYSERVPIDARGQTALRRASAVYIGDEVAARMGAGEWRDVEEFELRTCVGASYEQVDVDNDCAVLPVVVIRDRVGPRGERGIEAGDELAGGAKARAAEVWSTGWSTTNTFVGTEYTNGISFETWLDINGSDSATTTYGGRTVDEAGSWFEAGALSQATVFNNVVTLLDTYVTLIGYDAGGGEAELKVEAMGFDIVDAIDIDTNDGITLTLEDILDLAGVSTTTTWSDELTLYGYQFDDGCGTVSAGIFLEGEIGIDNQATQVTVSAGGSGVTVDGDIVPTAGVTAVSKAEAAYYTGFLSIGIALEFALEIFTITLPFESTITYTPGTPATLGFTEMVSLGLSTLAGSITFSFDYEYTCAAFWNGFKCSGDHSHTLASWDGIEDTWTLFDWSQTLQFGTGASFCDNYDGQWIDLRTVHDEYVDLWENPVGQEPDADDTTMQVSCVGEDVRFRRVDGFLLYTPDNVMVSTIPNPPPPPEVPRTRFTAVAQSDGTWAFQTAGGRYLRASSNSGVINQQTYVGSYERFEVIPE